MDELAGVEQVGRLVASLKAATAATGAQTQELVQESRRLQAESRLLAGELRDVRGRGPGGCVRQPDSYVGGQRFPVDQEQTMFPLARVLVVEDNADCRASLDGLLGLNGFGVEVAADGPQGVAKALAWRPDAAVIDIGLPGLNGFEVARAVRAALGPTVLLVALTAYEGDEFRVRGLGSGFDRYLVKPTDPAELLRLLAERGAPGGTSPCRAFPDLPTAGAT
jgi:CheY-like chemotaxis protein